MGFGLWVLYDNQSFIAVLRKCCNTHTQPQSRSHVLSDNTHVSKHSALLNHVGSAGLSAVEEDIEVGE